MSHTSNSIYSHLYLHFITVESVSCISVITYGETRQQASDPEKCVCFFQKNGGDTNGGGQNLERSIEDHSLTSYQSAI